MPDASVCQDERCRSWVVTGADGGDSRGGCGLPCGDGHRPRRGTRRGARRGARRTGTTGRRAADVPGTGRPRLRDGARPDRAGCVGRGGPRTTGLLGDTQRKIQTRGAGRACPAGRRRVVARQGRPRARRRQQRRDRPRLRADSRGRRERHRAGHPSHRGRRPDPNAGRLRPPHQGRGPAEGEDLRRDALERPGIQPREALAQIADVVRFTFTYNESAICRRACGRTWSDSKSPGSLKSNGATRGRREQYKGINTQWLEPNSGVRFEVQFHTQASLEAKELTHEAYERIRSITEWTPESEREAAELKQFQQQGKRQGPDPARRTAISTTTDRRDVMAEEITLLRDRR